jgi:putative addiction module component (TIGR02574 family)
MSRTNIFEELPLNLAELNYDESINDYELVTEDERALLEARLAAYEKDPDAGSSWPDVESRIRSHLTRERLS